MIKFQRVDPSIPYSINPEYIPLILPFVYPLYITFDPDHYWVTIEALQDNELIGLSLSLISRSDRIARLYSLVIAENYRKQGIGHQLFSFTENLLVKEEKIRSLDLEFEESDPYTPIMEKILSAENWSPAKIYLVRCHFNVEKFNPYWLNLPFRLPPSFRFFNWKEITATDRQAIQNLYDQGRFLPYLFPLDHEELIDWKTSIGLRHRGQIIGWSITHRDNPSTIRYAILYIDSAFLHTGYGIQLVLESIRLHKKSPTPNTIFEVNFHEIDPSWWRFVKKRLIPIAEKVERFKRTSRIYI